MAQLICLIVLVVLLIGCLIQLSVNDKRIKTLKEHQEQLKKDADALDLRLEGLQKIFLVEKDYFQEGFLVRMRTASDKVAKRVEEATTPEELHDAQLELDRLETAMEWIYEHLA